MRWKGPALALLGAAAVAGIAIGFTVGGGSDTTITNATSGPSTASGTGNSGATSETASTYTSVTLPTPSGNLLSHRLLVATVDDAVKQADPKLAASLIKICVVTKNVARGSARNRCSVAPAVSKTQVTL